MDFLVKAYRDHRDDGSPASENIKNTATWGMVNTFGSEIIPILEGVYQDDAMAMAVSDRAEYALNDDFIRAGENIAWAEVERLLELHPAVRQAVVVGCPDERLGDFQASLSACRVAEKRIHEICARYGVYTLLEAVRLDLDRAEARMRACIAAVPDGTCYYEDYLETFMGGRF